MNPQSIARLAWSQKDARTPEATILAELGLESFPTLATHDPAEVYAFSDCVTAFTEIIRGMDHRDTLPKQSRQRKGHRVKVTCRVCEKVERVHPWRAKRYRYCSPECSSEGQRVTAGLEATVVRMVRAGESRREIARKLGVAHTTVNRIWQQESERRRQSEQREAA